MLRLLFIALSSTLAISTANAAPNVVVSIKPLHSLTAGVMKGVGVPELILDGVASPHDFNLKPSQAKSIQDAGLVIWISGSLEGFLVKSLENLEGKTDTLEVMEIDGLSLLDFRDHEDHGEEKDHAKHDEHADHDDHAEHKDHDDHDDHAEHKDHGEHADHDGHAHAHGEGGKDPHVWMDIDNAKTITLEIAKQLAKSDPENAEVYSTNAKSIVDRLATLDKELQETLEDKRTQQYVVFHDGYQYFEKHFGLSRAIAVSINPEVQPSAARIRELQHEVEENRISCLFSEPQFSPKVLSVVAENVTASISTLDPLGSKIAKGEDQYFEMMTSLANSFSECAK